MQALQRRTASARYKLQGVIRKQKLLNKDIEHNLTALDVIPILAVLRWSLNHRLELLRGEF
jgi:hypothetical protein